MPVFRETPSRSLAKAVSWRVVATMATALLVYGFTRELALSLTVGGVEFLAKIGLFWGHERLWDQIPYGRKLDS